MRPIPWLAVLVVAAGCAGTNTSGAPPASGPALSAELFPFEASSAAFADSKDPVPRAMHVETAADGASANLVLEVPERGRREIRVTSTAGGLSFSGGVDEGIELIRFGAAPGASWQSGELRVVFEGWERLHLGTTSYDAARISTRPLATSEVPQVETWWFAPRVGLVRLRSDHGALFVDELVRTSP